MLSRNDWGNPAPTKESTSASSWSQPASSTSYPSTPAPAAPVSDSDLIESIYDVKVQQQDPTSPLHSIKTFEELDLKEEVLKGVYVKRFQRPSKIQEHALPLLLRNPPEHLIAQSQSGTGKTAAFALAVLNRIDVKDPRAQALVIAPSRELARQVCSEMNSLGQFTGVQVFEAIRLEHGGVRRAIEGHVVVGTPGTIEMLIKKRYLGTEGIKMLVLDEADYMLDLQNLGSQSLQVRRLVPSSTQIILFSATWDDDVVKFANDFVKGKANQIRLQINELTLRSISQFFIDCPNEEDRFNVLVSLYGIMTVSQSIIFVERRDTAEKIDARMNAARHHTSLLHGGLTPDKRDQAIDDFRRGRTKVLITTNVIARGIDIAAVNLVINYDLPVTMKFEADPTTYLHRIGRTGRFGRLGVCINFVHDQRSFMILKDIEQYYGCKMLKVPTDDAVFARAAKTKEERDDHDDALKTAMEEFIKKAMKEPVV